MIRHHDDLLRSVRLVNEAASPAVRGAVPLPPERAAWPGRAAAAAPRGRTSR